MTLEHSPGARSATTYNVTPQNIGPAAFTKLTGWTVESDPGGLYVPAQNGFVIAAAGTYLCAGFVTAALQNNPQDLIAVVYQNGFRTLDGSRVLVRNGIAGDLNGSNVTGEIQCQPGDVLNLYGYNNGGNPCAIATTGSWNNRFSITRLP